MITMLLAIVQVILLIDYYYFNIFNLLWWQAYGCFEFYFFLFWLDNFIVAILNREAKRREQFMLQHLKEKLKLRSTKASKTF